MAKITLTTRDAAHGPFFLLSTASKPDSIRLVRNPQQRHLHQATFSLEAWNKMQDDLGLRSKISEVPISITFELEDRDKNGGDQIENLKAELQQATDAFKAADEANAKLAAQVAAHLAKQPTTAGPMDETIISYLNERDAILARLAPYAKGEEDSPVDVLSRIIQAHAAALDRETDDPRLAAMRNTATARTAPSIPREVPPPDTNLPTQKINLPTEKEVSEHVEKIPPIPAKLPEKLADLQALAIAHGHDVTDLTRAEIKALLQKP
jgi:hypothetical protein